MICGSLGNTKDSAKKLATFAYCKKLYMNKMLNDHLKVINFVIKGYRVDAKFNYPHDPKFLENLKKLGSDPKNKDLLYVPISAYDPLVGKYEEKGEKFVGYIYSVKFRNINIPEETGIDIKASPLAFIYFNEDLNDAKIDCKTNELHFFTEFSLIDTFEFTIAEYQKFITYNRFYDCTVRNWDINFFEMFTGVTPHEKSTAHRRKKKNVGDLKFSDTLKDGKPIYPFLVALNEDGEPDLELHETLDSYITKIKARYLELCQVETNKKITYDEEFAVKFREDESLREKKAFQTWVDLRKVYVKEVSLLKTKLAESDASLLEKMYFGVDDHEKNPDDYTLKVVSLREYLENIQKGKIKYDSPTSMFCYELTEYPLNQALLLHIMLFKGALEPVKIYLKILYFKREILIKLEEESKLVQPQKLTFQPSSLQSFFNDNELNSIYTTYAYRQPFFPYKPIPENLEQTLPYEKKDYSNKNLTSTIAVPDLLKSLKTSQYDVKIFIPLLILSIWITTIVLNS